MYFKTSIIKIGWEMALKSTSKQMCVYIFIVNTYEVGHLYLTIRTEWKKINVYC